MTELRKELVIKFKKYISSVIKPKLEEMKEQINTLRKIERELSKMENREEIPKISPRKYN